MKHEQEKREKKRYSAKRSSSNGNTITSTNETQSQLETSLPVSTLLTPSSSEISPTPSRLPPIQKKLNEIDHKIDIKKRINKWWSTINNDDLSLDEGTDYFLHMNKSLNNNTFICLLICQYNKRFQLPFITPGFFKLSSFYRHIKEKQCLKLSKMKHGEENDTNINENSTTSESNISSSSSDSLITVSNKNKTSTRAGSKRFRSPSIKESSKIKNQLIQILTFDIVELNYLKKALGFVYDIHIQQFALLLFILGGRNCYEFLRLNLPGALPHNISNLELLMRNQEVRIIECEFRFKLLKEYSQSNNCNYIFSSEDCTSCICHIDYDVQLNSFIGFASPLIDGMPQPNFFRTENFEELKMWFNNCNKSKFINIHMIQTVVPSASPFILSAFGSDNKFTATDVLKRWLYIYNQCLLQDIRVIGFSSDGDPRCLKTMRLCTRFFAELPNLNLYKYNDNFNIKIPEQWSWFFMKDQQILLFMQDPPHIATKFRNRLLSEVALMKMGDYSIDIQHLMNLIELNNKLEHNLIKCDNDKEINNYSINPIKQLNLTESDIEKLIENAFELAKKYVAVVNMTKLLINKNIYTLPELSRYIKTNTSKSSSKVVDNTEGINLDQDSDDDELKDEINDSEILDDEHRLSTNSTDDDDDDDDEGNILASDLSDVERQNFHGCRIYDIINPQHAKKYVRIRIGTSLKYLHKQTAC
ncbi:unnamed protein product [Rotaria sp. Silwood1]|nr:unnamed protein product [Rotaria sp. Silwood1]